MAVRDVLQLGNPILRDTSAPVDDPAAGDIADLIVDLEDTLAHWKSTTGYGRGIAAPQIGVLRRVIFLNVGGCNPWPMINPEIVDASDDTIVVWDACLSFLTIFFCVTRHARVSVSYQDVYGVTQRVDAEGDLAELLQHEIDHLDGILALDRICDHRTIISREEFEARYRGCTAYSGPSKT